MTIDRAAPEDIGSGRDEGHFRQDSLFAGRLKLYQPAPGFGYRVNVDALLLAAFAARERRMAHLAVDLGAGVGALGLALLYLGAARRVEFIERDELAAELCRRNLAANGWQARGAVHTGDLAHSMRTLAPRLLNSADLVVFNPPYFSARHGGRSARASSGGSRELARRGELEPFLRAAASTLGRRGRLCVVYPAAELLEQMTMARKLGLVPKRLRFVHGRPDRPARISLLECSFGKDGGLVVQPPLIEFDQHNHIAAELADLLGSPPSAPGGMTGRSRDSHEGGKAGRF